MTELVRYEAVKRALADATAFDEVKDILDIATGTQEYARRAKDRSLIHHAAEIRLWAERRAGELLNEMKVRGERDSGKGLDRKSQSHGATVKKLSNLGITKSQSSRWQKLAKLPEQMFEERVEQAKKQAIASVDRTAQGRAEERFQGLRRNRSG